MPKTVGIGYQNFQSLIQNDLFYIDKTDFIKEWWENYDHVTLITRPRRFGKTITLSMIEQFFSIDYANQSDLFKKFSIWQDPKYRAIQGTYPVLFLSFADVKENTFSETRKKMCQIIKELYNAYSFLLEGDILNEYEKQFFQNISPQMEDYMASLSLKSLCSYLSRFYRKKVIFLLDEYDTPMQEAYIHGYWNELVSFTRSLLNSTFKTNPYIERAIMTGITRVSKESVFSDLNNLEVVTTTSTKYSTSFGFTEDEVFSALDQFGLSEKREEVKKWYNGFTFGTQTDLYNPWSIINYLDKQVLQPYWTNTSSNGLVGKLIQEGNPNTKEIMEDLLAGKTFVTQIEEQIIYQQLEKDETAIWSLLLASGYLKVKNYRFGSTLYEEWAQTYELELTNFEVKILFKSIIQGWFRPAYSDYNNFIQALLADDLEAMNLYLNQISLSVFSFFDTGNHPSGREEPERFYHGFVLGLIVELNGCYRIRSNRESGLGRYDILMEPVDLKDDAIIIEFKVYHSRREGSLEETVQTALKQIEDKRYSVALTDKGIPLERIRKYGFAFRGKEVLIGA